MPRGLAVIEPLEGRTFLTVAGGGFTESAAAAGLQRPTAIAIGPNRDPPVYVSEKAGRIKYFRDGETTSAVTAVTLPVDSAGDRGILGMTVSKYFDNDRSLYVTYTTRESTPRFRVSRFYAFRGDVMLSSEKVLLDLPAYDGADGQNGAGLTALGGGVRFAYDGTLLVGVGDAGRKENAGSLDSPFGKILRVKPDGGVPADNPFAGADGWKKFVWAYGLHDPASFAVHPENGIVFLNDPGQSDPGENGTGGKAVQEVNRLLPGVDYGWPSGEGTGFGTGVGAAPVYQYPTDPADLTADTPAAGGEVRGGVFFSPGTLTFPIPFGGDYFFADRQAGIVQVLEFGNFRLGGTEVFATDLSAPTDMAFDVEGDLYVVAQGLGEADGKVLRYTPNGAPAVVRHPKGGTATEGGTFTLRVEAGGKDPFFYQWQRDGRDIPGATEPTYTAGPLALADDGATYRVIVSNDVGSAYSRPATVHVVAGTPGGGGTDGGNTGGGTDGGGNNGGGGSGGGGGGNTPSPFPNSPTAAPQGPFDLVPVVTSDVGGSVVGGSAGRATVRLYNLGLNVSPARVSVNLYLSSDRFLDDDDMPVVALPKTLRLKPGGSKVMKLKFAYPAGVDANDLKGAGDTYRLLANVAAVAAADAAMETDALNNTAASDGAVRLVPPTVDVQPTVGPSAAAAKAGGKLVLPVVLSNAGNAPTPASAVVTLVVSVVAGGELAGTSGAAAAGAVAAATAVGTFPLKAALAPGQQKKLKFKVALPADLAAGAYTFVVSVDTANVVPETDETNNTAVAPAAFTVG